MCVSIRNVEVHMKVGDPVMLQIQGTVIEDDKKPKSPILVEFEDGTSMWFDRKNKYLKTIKKIKKVVKK